MRLDEHLPLFCNEFDKFNNKGALMLDSIYHMTLKLLINHFFSVKTSRFCHFYSTLYWMSIHYALICNHKWFIDFIAWRYFTSMREVM